MPIHFVFVRDVFFWAVRKWSCVPVYWQITRNPIKIIGCVTQPHPEKMLLRKGNPRQFPISGKSRMVKYDNLARFWWSGYLKDLVDVILLKNNWGQLYDGEQNNKNKRTRTREQEQEQRQQQQQQQHHQQHQQQRHHQVSCPFPNPQQALRKEVREYLSRASERSHV